MFNKGIKATMNFISEGPPRISNNTKCQPFNLVLAFKYKHELTQCRGSSTIRRRPMALLFIKSNVFIFESAILCI